MRHDADERLAKRRFVDQDDVVDDGPNDIQREGVGIQIARQSVGERFADLDRRSADPRPGWR